MAVCLFLFMFCFFMFFFYSVNYLLILLYLELVLLTILFMFFFGFFSVSGFSGPFFFLLVMVCMGGFGISLLVFSTRFFGNDFWVLKFIF